MILTCHNICKSFGTDEIIKSASFHIEDREKVAITGINGAGKSTLLKIIMNLESADSGDVILSKGKSIGYLAQHQDLDSNHTIYEELLEVKRPLIEMEQSLRTMERDMQNAEGKDLQTLMETYSKLNHTFELQNGYAYKSEINGVLKGLGFDEKDYDKPLNTLSGGQKTRVSLGKLLLTKPDLLLLDEPTNHLDLNSIAWLETFLLNYPGAVIIISHDRYFLNKVVSKIIEIDNTEVTVFHGNYTAYSEKKAQLRISRMNLYLNQQREIKHQEEVIAKLKSFNREKSIRRAESREKALKKIDVIEKPLEVNAKMNLILEPHTVSGNDVLSIKNLSKSFDRQVLFEDVSIEIKRGERIAIIGDNGTGKTTLLKIINNMIPADSGELILGTNVQIGYYDQEHHVLHMEKTVFEEIADSYPTLTQTKIRNVLAAFLFTNDDVFKKIESLSGGERGRVSLAKLMLSEANFLILDEPTNHLDMVSKEILEHALNHYTGTVLYVSHDRYFINETSTRILDLKNKTFVNYIGNYDYYLEKNEAFTKIYTTPQEAPVAESKPETSKLSWQQQKEQQAALRKLENELKKVEEAIHSTEERLQEINQELTLPEVYTDIAKCTALAKEKDELELNLENYYEKWEILEERLAK